MTTYLLGVLTGALLTWAIGLVVLVILAVRITREIGRYAQDEDCDEALADDIRE